MDITDEPMTTTAPLPSSEYESRNTQQHKECERVGKYVSRLERVLAISIVNRYRIACGVRERRESHKLSSPAQTPINVTTLGLRYG